MSIYTYQTGPEYLEHYLSWDDSKFMVYFADNRFLGTECHNMLVRLKSRNLLKRVYQKQIKELPEICRDAISTISTPKNKRLRSDLESFLWPSVCSLVDSQGRCQTTCSPDNPKFMIVHAYTIKSVREMSRNDEASIHIHRGVGEPSTFEVESTLFKSIDERLNQAFVEIYAPVTYDTPIDRTRLLKKMDEHITEKLSDFFKGDANATA